ncbi:MAG: penicillin-binding protein [Bacilli bacterium]|nr:penicillin-binding protein [Bacilli bacterium]
MKRKKTTVNISLVIFIVLILSFFSIVIKLSMVSLRKTTDGVDLKQFKDNRNTETEVLPATRGTIYSADGEVLAQTINSYTVVAYLSESRTKDPENPQHVVDKDRTAEELSGILGMSKEYILKLLNSKGYQVELGPGGRDINIVLKRQIEALNLPGIGFIESKKRYYPMTNFASYIIGYAKKTDNNELVGEMGIEAYYDEQLAGTDGYTIYQKDAYGYTMPNTTTITEPAKNGEDIYLTIDSKIQMFVENGIKDITSNNKMDWLTFTIADAKTGAIVASSSNQNFNLNTKDNITSYLNPLTSYVYEPGSTMKIYSWLAAMENGIYDGKATYKSGTIQVDDAIIKDFNGKGWGVVDFDYGFVMSSNVGATNLGLKLGREKLHNYYKDLGFGKKTGLSLPNELAGDIDFVYRTELATASFGQGITTTPIQNIQALTLLANDGIELQPYIVEKTINSETGEVTYQHERTELGRKASSENAAYMRKLMYDVVYSGKTDAMFYKTENVSFIGKTGTAQIAGPNGSYLTGSTDYVRSFAGMFPYEDPQYVVYVSVKKYTGSYRDFARMVKKVVEEIAKYKNITELMEKIDETKIIEVNNYISTDASVTEEKLKAMNLTVIRLGNGKYIINQYPEKGSTIIAGSKIFLLTNDEKYTLPNMVGWSSSEATTLCRLLGIKYKISGYGFVKEQSVEEGTEITEDMELSITLE